MQLNPNALLLWMLTSGAGYLIGGTVRDAVIGFMVGGSISLLSGLR